MNNVINAKLRFRRRMDMEYYEINIADLIKIPDRKITLKLLRRKLAELNSQQVSLVYRHHADEIIELPVSFDLKAVFLCILVQRPDRFWEFGRNCAPALVEKWFAASLEQSPRLFIRVMTDFIGNQK